MTANKCHLNGNISDASDASITHERRCEWRCRLPEARMAATDCVQQWRESREKSAKVFHRHCQVDEKLVDRPPRYWAPARLEPTMLSIKTAVSLNLTIPCRLPRPRISGTKRGKRIPINAVHGPGACADRDRGVATRVQRGPPEEGAGRVNARPLTAATGDGTEHPHPRTLNRTATQKRRDVATTRLRKRL